MDIEKFIPIVMFIVIGFIIKSYYDFKIKKTLIDKGEINANVQHFFKHHPHPRSHNPLRWGVVLFAVGAALLIGEWFHNDLSDGMTIGLMLIFAGLALIFTHKLNGDQHRETPPPAAPSDNQPE